MLSWFKGDKVDHPLASVKELRRIVDALPAKDPFKMLEEAGHWLASVTETEGFKVDQRFEVIDSLDTATHKAQERLRQLYLALQEQEQVQEKRICKAATDFWQGLGRAYLVCVRQARDASNVSSSFKFRVPLLAARATRALRYEMHWVSMRYGVLRSEFWSDIAQCAQLAEMDGVVHSPVKPYADGGSTSSQCHEFLRVMMFWAASPSGLSPVEQDIAERLVAHLAPQFRYDRKFWDGCDYCFSLDASHPPLRCVSGAPVNAATRFFDGGSAWQAVQALSAEVASTQSAPHDVDWDSEVDGPTVARVLQHLGLNWAREMPARASVRRKTAMRLLVVHGYLSVQGAVEPAISEGLDFSDTLTHDSWVAVDVSPGGYGVIVPSGKGDWLRVGVLVAVRTENESLWALGIVRRVKGDEHRQHRIGIQLISKAPKLVHLRRQSVAGQGGKGQTALLLSTRPSRNGSLHIVARRDLFSAGETLEAVYGNPAQSVTLGPGNVIESGPDFDWLRFQALEALL